MSAHLKNIPRPPIEISSDLPQELSDIILKALEKDPAKRIQTADDFRSALLHLNIQEKGVSTSATTRMFVPSDTPTSATTRAVAPPDTGEAIKSAYQSSSEREAPNRRRLWIAVGLALVVLVVIAAAIQIPKLYRSAEKNEPEQIPAATSGEEAQTPGTAAEEDAAMSSISGLPKSEKSSTSVRSNSKESADSPSSSELVSETSRKPAAKPSGSLPENIDSQLEQIREQYNHLYKVRAAAIKEAILTLNRQVTTRKPRLRTEVANSARLMESHFKETKAALDRRDVPEAEQNLASATREMEKLERFLRVSNILIRRPAAKQKPQ